MACSNGCNRSGGLYTSYDRANACRHGRSAYAALNSLPRCERYRDDLFYTGPCPPAAGCGHHDRHDRYDCGHHGLEHGCHGSCHGHDCHSHGHKCAPAPVYGMFTAAAPMCLECDRPVPLTAAYSCADGFTVCGGSITLGKAGVYLAMYAFYPPANADADLTVSMKVNGVCPPAARMSVGGNTRSVIFNAAAGDRVCLSADEACGIAGTCGEDVFSLILLKIG